MDVTVRVDKGKEPAVSRILLENVLVLAVDIPQKGETTALVTLALTPEDATRVAQLQGNGTLSLALRRFRDGGDKK